MNTVDALLVHLPGAFFALPALEGGRGSLRKIRL
jgi:hypothetical protein